MDESSQPRGLGWSFRNSPMEQAGKLICHNRHASTMYKFKASTP